MNLMRWAVLPPALRANSRPRGFENCRLPQVRVGHRRCSAGSGASRSIHPTPRPSGCTSADSRPAKEGFGSIPVPGGHLGRTAGADRLVTATSGPRPCSATPSLWSTGPRRCPRPRTGFRSNSWNSATFGTCRTDLQSLVQGKSSTTGPQTWCHGQRQDPPTGWWRITKQFPAIGSSWLASQDPSLWPRLPALPLRRRTIPTLLM